MRMSVITTSGRIRTQISLSESMSPADATTSMPGSIASSSRSPSLTMRLSSPTTTRSAMERTLGRWPVHPIGMRTGHVGPPILAAVAATPGKLLSQPFELRRLDRP
jgi:hypothetical protein